jgi:hypothetical protein
MATKQKKETYQTVGERVLEALNKLPKIEHEAFRRNLSTISKYYNRILPKKSYDKFKTPADIISLCLTELNMDFNDFIPQNLLSKNRILYMNLGLKKPEKAK